MEASLNEFTKKHMKALREGSFYTLINGNDNYEKLFGAHDIKTIYKFFANGISTEDGFNLKLPPEDIVGFYALYHNNFNKSDIQFLQDEGINIDIEMVKNKVLEMKQFSSALERKIEMQLETMETYTPVEYEHGEYTEDRFFKLYLKKDNEKDRLVNEADTLDVFEYLEPNKRYPVIIYSNPSMEYKYKCSNNDIVDFDSQFLLKLKLPPNSVSFISKVGIVTTLNFETATTIVKTNPQRGNDDKLTKVTNFVSNIFFDEEVGTFKKIQGKIRFEVDTIIDYYSFYTYLITDPIASVLFYVDETARAWCSKDNFIVFFRDYSPEMVDATNIKNNDTYLKFTIPTQDKESISGFSISFQIKSKEVLPSFLYKFSRILRHFILTNTQVGDQKKFNGKQRVEIHTKPGNALVAEAPEFFKPLSKDHSEVSKTGKQYRRKCQAGDQPIIIKESEVNDWKIFGREPIKFPPPEWGFKKEIWIVCPTDAKQNVVFHVNEQDETGRVKMLPCCNETGILKAKTTMDTIASGTGRSGITEAISNLSSFGALNESLSRFLSLSLDKEGKFSFKKQGTVFKDQPFTFINSAIIALLDATELQLEDGIPLSIVKPVDIEKNVNIVRKRMAMIPPDIYRQELYDMTDEEIIQSILDPNTYIDPYLYYRGLETIFDVQIITFTSFNGRANPFSEEENNLPISSLEIPRCKFTHIRNIDNKPIVCIYKNYGLSKSNKAEIPACELIVCVDSMENLFAKRIDSIFVGFFKNIFDLIKRSCHPIEWERTKGKKIGDCLYDDPYSSVDWGKYNYGTLGIIQGQEIDIYGKTTALIFNDWTLIIPPTQPLPIYETDYRKVDVKIRSPDGTYRSHQIFASGTKIRPKLRSLEEVKENFVITEVDEEGAWMEFNGKKRGIMIPYLNHKKYSGRSMDMVYNLITRKNNVSILMQIINWMWRSEWTVDRGYPKFINWWAANTEIDNSIIFEKVPKPFKNCSNYMFPRNCNSFGERIFEMSKLWPYFFYHGKIHVSKELYDRIQNFFNVEDIYSSGLTPDDIYGEPGRFITKLIPTDDDLKSGSSIILTEPEHVEIWVSRNNSSVFKYNSYFNANIIRENITMEMKKMVDYYLYSEVVGDNTGQIYMIQNSAIPSQPPQLSALNIAQHWRTHERNPGAYYRKEDDVNFSISQRYVIYKIGPQGNLEISVDKSEGMTDYLQVLNYDDDIYAAMIPLLLSSVKEESEVSE